MQLTKAEEQIMQIIWNLGKGTVQDILKQFGSEKPARTTVATILSILENKGFVTHEIEGRTNIYSALVRKDEYSKKQLFGFLKDYFDGSFSSMASFFAKKSNMTIEELDELIEETKRAIQDEQNKK